MCNAELSTGDTFDKLDTQVSDIYGLHELALPSYSAQVLPFDLMVTGTVSTARCALRRLGVEIWNEGSGISVDDAEWEAWATFVARAVEPMQTRGNPLSPRSATFGIRSRGFWYSGCKWLIFSEL